MNIVSAFCSFFNSHPHKEDDEEALKRQIKLIVFNSHPHKEDDAVLLILLSDCEIFNSHPHKEDDGRKRTRF